MFAGGVFEEEEDRCEGYGSESKGMLAVEILFIYEDASPLYRGESRVRKDIREVYPKTPRPSSPICEYSSQKRSHH